MKILKSDLFPDCSFSEESDVGIYDRTPVGFDHPVSLYIADDTVQDDSALDLFGAFLDRLPEWDRLCRDLFIHGEENSETEETVSSYFDFFMEEVPEVFETENPDTLSRKEQVEKLQLVQVATHDTGGEQFFVVDFTLGYDQILCVYFNNSFRYSGMGWES